MRAHTSLVVALAVALATACCGRDAPPSAEAAPPPDFAQRLTDVPIENFARVGDGLYRGAQPDAAGFRALRALGVRTVISFRERHSDREAAEAAGLAVIEMPLHAFVESEPPTDDEVRAFLDSVRDPAKAPVFVHCAYGKDRTGTMCAVYRMEVDGWAPEKALEEMRSFGFHERYTDLERFVRSYVPRAAPPR